MITQKLEYISFTSYAILLGFNPVCSVASHVFLPREIPEALFYKGCDTRFYKGRSLV